MELYQFQQPPEDPAWFCRTPAAEDMLRVVRVTMKTRGMGSLVAAPGAGKTMVMRYCAETIPGARYAVMNPVKTSPSAFLELICAAVEAHPTKSCAQMHDIICNAVKWQGVRALLIDEAQHLSDQCLDELRCIHDEAGVPVVLAGNHELRTRLTEGQEAAFAQLTSRIGARFEQKATTEADVRALAEHHGVGDRETVSWLAERYTGVGGLRRMARLIDLARATADNDEIRLSDLKNAAVALGADK